MIAVFALLVAFQVKHFLADYLLQTPYMLGKFKARGWAEPLALHCAVHALFTYLIALGFALAVKIATGRPVFPFHVPVLLAAFDFVVHFVMDRIKASPKLMGRWKPVDPDTYKGIQLCLAVQPQGPAKDDELGQALFAGWKGMLRGNKLFWWALGLDQAVHHLTHYAVIAVLVLW